MIDNHPSHHTDEGGKQLPTDTKEETPVCQSQEHDSSHEHGVSAGSKQAAGTHDSGFSLSTLDRKYSTSGKYASDLGSRPAGQSLPSTTTKMDLTLPYLDLLHKQVDSDESFVSEGES